jgi:hypothetical protein
VPSKQEWIKIHAALTAKLRVPCRLKFSHDHRVGFHRWDFVGCSIHVNPDADFRVPEHLILHEAAHHRAGDLHDSYSHDAAWARVLLGMYRETGIALPHTTGFEEFARAAGIVCKVFDPNEDRQMVAIAENPQLVEGA